LDDSHSGWVSDRYLRWRDVDDVYGRLDGEKQVMQGTGNIKAGNRDMVSPALMFQRFACGSVYASLD
jgi:hypothetical protein